MEVAARVTSKGQVTVPKAAREALGSAHRPRRDRFARPIVGRGLRHREDRTVGILMFREGHDSCYTDGTVDRGVLIGCVRRPPLP